MNSPSQIKIPHALLDECIAHCREIYPSEACGILAGQDDVIRKIFRITNRELSGTSYYMDPKEQLSAMKEIKELGLEMTAIYHSHPQADAYPSQKDISLAFYEDSLYVIVSLVHKEPEIRVFAIKEGSVEEKNILIIS